MAVIVSHDFTGDTAAASGLGTADTLQVWLTDSGSWRRLGGKAVGTNDGDVTSIPTGVSNMFVEAVVGPMAAGKYWEVLGRVKNASDFYWAEARPDGSVAIQYAFATPMVVTLPNTMPAAGGRLGLRCDGTTISAFVNGTQVASVTSTEQVAALGTRAGFRHGASGVQVLEYDTFRVSDLAVGNTAPTANAGTAQNVATGAVVTLTGTGTDVEGPIASFVWTLTARPVGSVAALSGTGAVRTFTADLAGSYTGSLVVTDTGGLSSVASTVTVTAAALPSGFFFASAGAYSSLTLTI